MDTPYNNSERPAKRQIEREFGVPIPGEILPPGEWTQTAVKSFPEGVIDFAGLFRPDIEPGGHCEPMPEIVLDLGCGNGRSTLWSAITGPQRWHLGTDILPVVIRYATRRANQRGLKNIRFGVIGGLELLQQHIAPGTISEIDVYHPQPFYDRRLIHKRLITPEFLAAAHTALQPGGRLVLQTDHPGYWNYMQEMVPLFFEWSPLAGRWPDAPRGRTRREILAMKRGLPVFRGVGTARADLDASSALDLARKLPPPTFNADRRLLALDQEE